MCFLVLMFVIVDFKKCKYFLAFVVLVVVYKKKYLFVFIFLTYFLFCLIGKWEGRDKYCFFRQLLPNSFHV